MRQRAAGGRSARAGPPFPPAPALLLLLASLTPAPATDGVGVPTLAAPTAARDEAYAFHSHGRPWRHDEGLWRHFDWSAITTLCASSDLQDIDKPSPSSPPSSAPAACAASAAGRPTCCTRTRVKRGRRRCGDRCGRARRDTVFDGC